MSAETPIPGRPSAGEILRLALAGCFAATVVFAFWEGLEAQVHDEGLRARLHYARGGLASLLAAAAVGYVGQRHRARQARQLAEDLEATARQKHDAQALLEVVVEKTPASLVVLDRDFRIVRANRTAERVHGGDLQGVRCYEALAGRRTPCSSCAVAESLAGAPGACRALVHTDPRTGEVMSVEAHPLPMPGGSDYVLLVERVITEQQKLQARLLHQEKMAAFGLLAAGVAHDLGNPLSSVEVQLQLLDEGRLEREDAEVIATVRQEVARLRRILRELVDFARRRRDEASLVSVQSVAQDALRLVRHDPRTRGVQVQEHYDPETPPVFVVEDHLMQVVLNLLLNAFDAMPAGGTLRVELQPVGERVALRVRDTGTGMDRQVLARCFEPLFSTKPPGKGTGLGLSISRDIVRAAGGEIELHSALGRGTTALVSLPAAALDSQRTVPA